MVHLPFIPFIIRNKVLWNSEYSVSIDLPIQKPLSVSCLRNIILPFAIGWNTKSSKPASASRLCSPRWWQQDLTASEQKLQERMERRVFIKTRVPMRKTSTLAWQRIVKHLALVMIMNGSFYAKVLPHVPSHSDFRDLRKTFVVNCVLKKFLSIPLSCWTLWRCAWCENVILAEDFENVAAKSCCFWFWAWFICSGNLFFPSGQLVKTSIQAATHT